MHITNQNLSNLQFIRQTTHIMELKTSDSFCSPNLCHQQITRQTLYVVDQETRVRYVLSLCLTHFSHMLIKICLYPNLEITMFVFIINALLRPFHRATTQTEMHMCFCCCADCWMIQHMITSHLCLKIIFWMFPGTSLFSVNKLFV